MRDRHALRNFAVFAVGCLVAAAWLIAVIGNVDPFAQRRTFTAEFANVQGLTVNDEVRISGVEVGKVEGIDVARGRALVTFSVDEDVAFGPDSTIAVRWRNTLGLRYLYVEPTRDGDVADGAHFALSRTRSPADLNALLARLTPVMRALDPELANVVVAELAEALGGNETALRQLTGDAADLVETLAGRSQAAGRVLRNGAELVDAYADRERQLGEVIASFADVSESVAARNDVLIDAIASLHDVEIELERLLEDGDRDLRGLIGALDRASFVLSANHDEIERTVRTLGPGIVSYHRISRWGQWFNIRVPGLSAGERTLTTERGAQLPPRTTGPMPDTTATWPDVFRLGPGCGGGTC